MPLKRLNKCLLIVLTISYTGCINALSVGEEVCLEVENPDTACRNVGNGVMEHNVILNHFHQSLDISRLFSYVSYPSNVSLKKRKKFMKWQDDFNNDVYLKVAERCTNATKKEYPFKKAFFLNHVQYEQDLGTEIATFPFRIVSVKTRNSKVIKNETLQALQETEDERMDILLKIFSGEYMDIPAQQMILSKWVARCSVNFEFKRLNILMLVAVVPEAAIMPLFRIANRGFFTKNKESFSRIMYNNASFLLSSSRQPEMEMKQLFGVSRCQRIGTFGSNLPHICKSFQFPHSDSSEPNECYPLRKGFSLKQEFRELTHISPEKSPKCVLKTKQLVPGKLFWNFLPLAHGEWTVATNAGSLQIIETKNGHIFQKMNLLTGIFDIKLPYGYAVYVEGRQMLQGRGFRGIRPQITQIPNTRAKAMEEMNAIAKELRPSKIFVKLIFGDRNKNEVTDFRFDIPVLSSTAPKSDFEYSFGIGLIIIVVLGLGGFCLVCCTRRYLSKRRYIMQKENDTFANSRLLPRRSLSPQYIPETPFQITTAF